MGRVSLTELLLSVIYLCLSAYVLMLIWNEFFVTSAGFHEISFTMALKLAFAIQLLIFLNQPEECKKRVWHEHE